MLATNLTICGDFDLSIDLKFPNRSMSKLTKLFSLQVTNGTRNTNGLTVGSSILTVSVQPSQSDVTLMITYIIDKNQTFKCNVTKKLKADNWINLKISQKSGVYEIKLDYHLVYNKTNPSPKRWPNVELRTGNNYGMENTSAIVNYRNLEFNRICSETSKIMKYS